MEKILTTPAPLPGGEAVFVTGNHHVSLPHITPGGQVLALSHLSGAGGALVEYTGAPLFRLLLDGEPLAAQSAAYTNSFIPGFSAERQGLLVEWQFFAPQGIRGFVVRVVLKAKAAWQGEIQLQCSPGPVHRSLFHTRPLQAVRSVGLDSWTGCAALELSAGFGISALALAGGPGFVAAAGEAGLSVSHGVRLDAGRYCVVEFYAALGPEQDGACLANVDMRRRAGALYEEHTALLRRRRVRLPDPLLEERVNLNLQFCYYFSMGYPLDGDELMLTTSKSSRYYVAGAYWARDTLLWAFPAVLRLDAALARQVLHKAFTTYHRQGANHALYLNGGCLYPGFELDQLVAPVIALERYQRKTRDTDFIERPEVQRALAEILETLENWRDEASGLYHTELDPSDDPASPSLLVYDNALVLAALRFLNGRFANLTGRVAALEKALARHAVAETKEGPVLAWAVDPPNGPRLYDDPPGSLLLLPYYGWPAKDDPLYQNTLAFYFSRKNPFFYANGPLVGQGCEHAPAPWPMSLCNLLLVLGPRRDLLDALRAMPMDNGVACETVRAEDGALHTGAAFATFAGFYANALLEAFEDGS